MGPSACMPHHPFPAMTRKAHAYLCLLRSPPNDLISPFLNLFQLNALLDVGELGEINLMQALILNHLQQQLHLVDIMHEVSLITLVCLVFLEYFLDFPARTSWDLAEEVRRDVVHNGGLATCLLGLSDAVDWSDIADKRLGHVMDQGHLYAARDVDLGCQGRRGHHRHDRHAVHMVRDGLAIIDAEAAPALALGGLKALDQVEEGDR